MIIATLIVTLPFMVRELIPVLRAFGIEQELAAATLGASGWQIFRMVTFPALRWGFVYGVTLTFARALGEFGAVLVVSGGVQGRTETATTYIFRALDDRQYVGAYSAALVLGLMSLILVMGAELMRGKGNKQAWVHEACGVRRAVSRYNTCHEVPSHNQSDGISGETSLVSAISLPSSTY